MTKVTRYFLFGSVAFVVLGLTVGLVGYYGGLPGLAFVRATGPVELQYVPADATVVAYANVQDIMQSEFRQKVKQLEPAGTEKGQQELKDTLGIDLETDIRQVVACMLPGQGSAEKNGLVVATGNFSQAKIEGFIREKGGVGTPYGGTTIFTHKGINEGLREHAPAAGGPALAFLQQNVVAIGNETAVRRAIDLGANRAANVISNSEMMDQIQRLEDGNVWAVGHFEAIAGSANLPKEVAGQIPAVSWFAASGRVNGGVSGTLSVVAKDDDAAKNLREVAGGFMALARLQAGSKPEVDQMLKLVQLGGDGRTVSLSFSLPSQLLDQLMAQKLKTGTAK